MVTVFLLYFSRFTPEPHCLTPNHFLLFPLDDEVKTYTLFSLLQLAHSEPWTQSLFSLCPYNFFFQYQLAILSLRWRQKGHPKRY
jgi:hypothetical protein